MELNREHFRAIIFYNFRRGLTQEHCIDELNSNFWQWGHSSLQDEFREGRPINAVRKLILQDRHVIYIEMKATLDISGEGFEKQ